VHDTDVVKVDLDVAYVAMAIHLCCKYLFRMFHLLQTYVASDFIWMLHMLQWLYTYVAISNVSSASDVCYRKCFHVASVS
jgi:hypothetical protein